MNVNMLPAYLLGGIFAVASLHLALEVVLGVRRWWRRRMAEPVYTYGILWPNAPLEDITRHDYQALCEQGYAELTDATWDAEIDQAISLTEPRPDYGPILDLIAHNEAARNLTDDRLRDWVEGKR